MENDNKERGRTMRQCITVFFLIWFSLFGFLGRVQASDRVLPLPKADVLIDVGHGGIDGGTSHGELLEKDINLEIAKKTFQVLNEKGFSVIVNRTGDYALSEENRWLKHFSRHKRDLAQRAQLANDLKPLIMISLHVNSSRDRRKTGPLVLQQNKLQSILLASSIINTLNRLYQTDEKPVYGKKFYLLNRAQCPTVIVELGYMTNEADRSRLTNPGEQSRIAHSLCSAVEQYFALTHWLPQLNTTKKDSTPKE
jgi:N-acetylmuramoyl-L-alanine amidase